MKKISALALILAIGSTAGCSMLEDSMTYTNGQQISDKQMMSFTDRETTANEVAALIGHPEKRKEFFDKDGRFVATARDRLLMAQGVGNSYIPEGEMWIYPYTSYSRLPTGDYTDEAAIFWFGKSGILIKHYKIRGYAANFGH